MTGTFFALLTAYYYCDAAATLQPLPPSTAQACAAHYEAVKSAFHPEAAESPASRMIAYRRFKAWETENSDAVMRLRAQAAEEARNALVGAPI